MELQCDDKYPYEYQTYPPRLTKQEKETRYREYFSKRINQTTREIHHEQESRVRGYERNHTRRGRSSGFMLDGYRCGSVGRMLSGKRHLLF